MTRKRRAAPMSAWIGHEVAEVRRAIRWSQADLGRHVGLAQSVISDIEGGKQPELSLGRAELLLETMGARLRLSVDRPRVAGARLRDPVHVRCSAFIARRLTAAGWEIGAEVEVGGDRSRGWIDLLAYNRLTGSVLVVEVKTELHEIGELERALSWYEREAWPSARRLGWRPQQVGSVVLLLATEENDRVAQELRTVLGDRFPIRAPELNQLLASGEVVAGRRGLALVDPRSRRRTWIRPLCVDGRRSIAPYRDYLDAVRRMGR